MNKIIPALLMAALLASAVFAGIKPASADGSLNINWTLLDNSLRPGGAVTMLLTVTNPSTAMVYNVNLNFTPSLGLAVSPGNVSFNTLSPGAVQSTSIRIVADQNAPSGSAFIEIAGTYQTGSAQGTQQNLSIWVPVAVKSVPDLQIEDIKYDKAVIAPGSSVTISFKVKNYGDGPAKNVKVSMDKSASVFTVDMNEKFIAEVLPINAFSSVSFSLRIQPSLAVGTYNFPITISYKDNTGNTAYSSDKYASMDVYGSFNLLVTAERVGTTVRVKISNAGTLEAMFLEVKILGLSISTGGSSTENRLGTSETPSRTGAGFSPGQVVATPSYIYVGNLQPNDYDTEDISLQFGDNTRGQVPVNIELTYQDLFGKKFTETKTVMVSAYSASTTPRTVSGDNNLYLVLIGAAIVVAVPTGYYLRRRRRRRAAKKEKIAPRPGG